MCRSGRPPSLARFQGGKGLGMLGRQLSTSDLNLILNNSLPKSALKIISDCTLKLQSLEKIVALAVN